MIGFFKGGEVVGTAIGKPTIRVVTNEPDIGIIVPDGGGRKVNFGFLWM